MFFFFRAKLFFKASLTRHLPPPDVVNAQKEPKLDGRRDVVWWRVILWCLNVSLWRSLFRVQEKNYREVDEQLHQAQVLLEVPANRIMCTQLLALISDITKARDMTQVLPYSWFGQFRSVGPNRNLECAAFLAFLKDQTGREKEFLRTQASQAKEVRSRSGEWVFLSSLVCEAKLRSSMK